MIVLVIQLNPAFYSRNDISRRHALLEKWRAEERTIMQEGGRMLFRSGVGQQRWLYVFKNAKTMTYILSRADRDKSYRWIE